MKVKLYDGEKWQELSGGGGGSGHTHPNLTLLNSITQAMVTAWQSAATWVTTNGANVLAHIADSLLHVPSGGTAGQVLTKTATGTEWATGGGGGSFGGIVNRGTASVRKNYPLSITISDTDTAILLTTRYGGRWYSGFIPIDMLTSTDTAFAIGLATDYLEVLVSISNNTVTISRSSTTAYTMTAYSF